MAVDIVHHRFNVAEYEAMIRHGILTDRDRVELIAGEIVEMPPPNPPHSGDVNFLSHFFTMRLGRRAMVANQQAVEIPPDSMPQPDLMLLRWRDDFYRGKRPYPEDVLLLIEVADTSMRRDRILKLRIYANAGIAECWIVDINGSSVEAYTEPVDDGYAKRLVARGGDRLSPTAFPDINVGAAEILGEREE